MGGSLTFVQRKLLARLAEGDLLVINPYGPVSPRFYRDGKVDWSAMVSNKTVMELETLAYLEISATAVKKFTVYQISDAGRAALNTEK
jgi:hypothetical protein